jgi:hypothetical protein
MTEEFVTLETAKLLKKKVLLEIVWLFIQKMVYLGAILI